MSTDTDRSAGGALTELLSDIETPSDAELISRVRGGDVAAYGELFSRHVEAANRLGRQLARGPDVDDLVSEAFAKVLQVLQGGGGPDVAFRAYLLTSVRRLHVDRVRASSKLQTSDDMTQFDPGIPFQDTAVADFENGAAAKAFASLPERWQLVLWHLEVEGQKPADIAPLLGMSPNSVSALAYRAREGLRQAFLTMHLADISADNCRWVNEHLGAYVRKGLSRRDATKVEDHLDECRRCMAMYLELTEVNSNLAGIIAPLLLGAAAASYCASTGTAAGITGVSALFGRARDFVSANAGATTAGAVAAGVAAVATAGVMILGPDTARVISADEPISETTSLPNEAPAPAPEPPAETDERTAPGRDEPRSDEPRGAAEDPVDEPAQVADEPVLDPPVAPAPPVGAPDGGPASQPGGGPGGPGGDGPGQGDPGQGGPDGPGTDGPGAPAGPDQPGEQPGTDEPGTDGPPPTNPGPGPEENPGSQPPGDNPDDGSTDEEPGESPGSGEPGGDGPDDSPSGPPPNDPPVVIVDPPPVVIAPPPGPVAPDPPPVVLDPDPVIVEPPVDVPVPVQFSVSGTVGGPVAGEHGNNPNLAQVSITFAVPAAGGTVTLTFEDTSDRFCGTPVPSCKEEGTPSITRTLASGEPSQTVSFDAWLPGGEGSLVATLGDTSVPVVISRTVDTEDDLVQDVVSAVTGKVADTRVADDKAGLL